MGKYDKTIDLLLQMVASVKNEEKIIPIGISNRHIHLCESDLYKLFGNGYELTPIKDLSQKGQYACKETLTICGAKGAIEKVRILGPVRKDTQVEILAGDCFKLGVKCDIRTSGDIDGTPSLTLIGKNGSVELEKGVIVAKRHIHMTPQDAQELNVLDKEIVCIKIDTARGGIYDNTTVRVTDESTLECHLDTEEANAMGITSKDNIKIIKN